MTAHRAPNNRIESGFGLAAQIRSVANPKRLIPHVLRRAPSTDQMKRITSKPMMCALVTWIACAFVIMYGAVCTGMSVPVSIAIARELSRWLAAPFYIIPGSLLRAVIPSGPAAPLVVVPIIATFWACLAFAAVALRQKWLRRRQTP